MRLGIISDIHSNFEALWALSKPLTTVDKVLCLGDMVGYYCQPKSRKKGLVSPWERLDLSFISNQRALIAKTSHSVFRNMVRFQTGEIALKVDDVWKNRMKPPDKVTVTAPTWPLLFKYDDLVKSRNSEF